MTPSPNPPNRSRSTPISGRSYVLQGAFPGGSPRVAAAGGQGAIQRSPNGTSFQLPPSVSLGRASGQRMPEPVQQKMESFFGADFSDVRIHVGSEASSIGALAFTHGSNIYFAPGLYNPGTPQGLQLLGHELTHVVQQRAGRVRNPFGSGVAVVQDPLMEAEAERMGLRAAMVPTAPAQAKMADGSRPSPIASDGKAAHVRAALAR